MANVTRNPLAVVSSSQMNGRASTSGAARRMSTKPPPPQAADRRLTFASKPKEQNRNSIGRRQTMAPKPNTGTAVANRPSIGMRRQSTVFGEVGGKPDPRNIKDKATIHRYIQELIRYLTTNGFDQSISPKVLTAPSSKDFFYIFKFLVNQIDNHFDYSGKPDEDVCMIFKLLRYPFGMSKRSLLSVGTPHTWPALLSALAWFVELLNYNQVVLTLEEEEPDDKLFFRFCFRAYELFLAGANEFPVLEEELAANFLDKNKQLVEETDMLKKRHLENLSEIERLKTGPHRLKTVLEKKMMFERDTEKFKSLIGQLEVRQTGLDKKLYDITKAVSTSEQELEAAQREKIQLEQALAQQELNKVDAEKINKERSQLEEGLRMVHAQQEELKKAIWSKELELSRVYEDASTSVKEYNSRATDIGLIPSTSKRAHGISYEIKFEPHDGEHMLSKDVKRDIKPHFESLLTTLRTKLESSQFQEMDLQDQLTTLQETYQDKCNSNKRLQNELKNTELLYSGQRESLESQSRLKESQISSLKDETRTVKQQAQHELVQCTSLLETTQKQLDLTRQQVLQEREDIKTNITMMVEMLANHKQHVEDRLKELQQFYSEQYTALQM